ncbi:Glycosyltransferase sugar-binding region containing DXD motif-containing protein [Fibrobacter sp. UWB15]|uniref:glycosyltransferase family 32 protein n=1 Tax=unclassified Fibrobacter TaxID=2634177 RepID=UPI00091A5295|nr:MULTISPECIES: glycosyltransferase [unclassified Fibrobacter]PWJ65606.1 glycosyl transferase-like sugar-binding protein [Fibrobacter sp. UWB6]SHF97992.1 Glycosyltransferase sugar-binding region containing DXD motif-containing protein [Fibrobacter sp. UWB8]SMG23745.1 Glycosyltransferase sugar-binding region containing DXD motif-containing protein [Fibrobacter sp. UWB15]
MENDIIPKQIHYCWFGKNPLSPLALKCIDSWKKFFPNYEIIKWDESNFDVDAFEYTREAYRAQKMAFVSDVARLFILAQHGGIYFDTDVEVVRPFDDILEKGGFMGIEAYDGEIWVNPGLGFGCSKNSKTINNLFEIYRHQTFDETKMTNCNIVTLTTEYLKKNGLEKENAIQSIDDITIYPKEYFNPCNMNTGKIDITEVTRSIHHYAASWADRSSLIRDWVYKKIYQLCGKRIALFLRKIFGRR